MMTVFGAIAWIHAKAPAVLPTVAFALLLQMSPQWKRQTVAQYY